MLSVSVIDISWVELMKFILRSGGTLIQDGRITGLEEQVEKIASLAVGFFNWSCNPVILKSCQSRGALAKSLLERIVLRQAFSQSVHRRQRHVERSRSPVFFFGQEGLVAII